MTNSSHIWALQRIASRSNCVRRQIAASIFDPDGRLLATGYNNPENPEEVCITDCPRARSTVAAYTDYRTGAGRCIAIHAEDAALRKTTPEERKGGIMYITAQPCNDCEKLLQASGLARWEVVGE